MRGDATSPAGFNFASQLRTKQLAATFNSSAVIGLGNPTTLRNRMDLTRSPPPKASSSISMRPSPAILAGSFGNPFGTGTTVGAFAGDYTLDGVVDAVDYIQWCKGLGRTYAENHYNAWVPISVKLPAAGSNAAIPEPGTLALLMFCGDWLVSLSRSGRIGSPLNSSTRGIHQQPTDLETPATIALRTSPVAVESLVGYSRITAPATFDTAFTLMGEDNHGRSATICVSYARNTARQ